MGARFTSIVVVAAGAAAFATASPAFAQAAVAPPAKTLQLPSVSFSIGTGVNDDGPVTLATGRYTLARHLVVEGDFSRWTGHQNYSSAGFSYLTSGVPGYTGDWRYSEDRSGWSAGANLLFQTTYKRLTWFGGGGVGYAALTYRSTASVEGCVSPAGSNYRCYPDYQFTDENRGLAVQAKTGVDFRIAGPMMAYGAVHFTAGPAGSIGASAGVRVVARSVEARRFDRARVERLERSRKPLVPASDAIGAPVRVTLMDGTQRRGTLMSLTDTDVVLRATDGIVDRRYTEARYQIANVRLVETTHRKAAKGLLWGLAAGAAIGVVSSLGCEEDLGYCLVVLTPIFGAAGAGVGAGIGGLIDHLAAPSHVIFANGNRSAQLIPITARKGGGVGIRLRW